MLLKLIFGILFSGSFKGSISCNMFCPAAANPSKSFAGVYAAFQAIMAASIIMAGYFGNSEQDSDIALGKSAGMVGCTICVLTAGYCMEHLNKWGLSLIISLFVWFFSSYSTSQMMQIILEK